MFFNTFHEISMLKGNKVFPVISNSRFSCPSFTFLRDGNCDLRCSNGTIRNSFRTINFLSSESYRHLIPWQMSLNLRKISRSERIPLAGSYRLHNVPISHICPLLYTPFLVPMFPAMSPMFLHMFSLCHLLCSSYVPHVIPMSPMSHPMAPYAPYYVSLCPFPLWLVKAPPQSPNQN